MASENAYEEKTYLRYGGGSNARIGFSAGVSVTS